MFLEEKINSLRYLNSAWRQIIPITQLWWNAHLWSKSYMTDAPTWNNFHQSPVTHSPAAEPSSIPCFIMSFTGMQPHPCVLCLWLFRCCCQKRVPQLTGLGCLWTLNNFYKKCVDCLGHIYWKYHKKKLKTINWTMEKTKKIKCWVFSAQLKAAGK